MRELELLISGKIDRGEIALGCKKHGWKKKSLALLEFISSWSGVYRRRSSLPA